MASYDNLFCVYDQTCKCKDRENQFYLQGLGNVLFGWQGAKWRVVGVIDRKVYPKCIGGFILFFFPKCFLSLSQKPLKWKAEFQNDLNNRKQKKTLQTLSSLRQKHIYTEVCKLFTFIFFKKYKYLQ